MVEINAYFDRSYVQSYYARLMSERLPREIDPLRLADEGVQLEGELPGEIFARLRDQSLPGSPPQPVVIALQFEHTAHGIRMLHGRVGTRLTAICQRCLGPVELSLEARPLLALLTPGESPAGAPEAAETLVVDGPVSLAELVEDELLLVMPMFPLHGEGQCTAPGIGKDAQTELAAEPEPAKQDGPFAALRGLKGKD